MCRFTTAMPFKVIIHHFLLLPRCNIALCFWPCPSMSRLPGWLAVPDSNRQFPQLEHRVQYRGAHIAHNYTMLSHSQSSSSGTQNAGEWAPRIKSNQPNLSGVEAYFSWPQIEMAECFWVAGEEWLLVVKWNLDCSVMRSVCASVQMCVFVCGCAVPFAIIAPGTAHLDSFLQKKKKVNGSKI